MIQNLNWKETSSVKSRYNEFPGTANFIRRNGNFVNEIQLKIKNKLNIIARGFACLLL